MCVYLELERDIMSVDKKNEVSKPYEKKYPNEGCFEKESIKMSIHGKNLI